MLIIFYLGFLVLLLGIIWFVTGLLLIVLNVAKKGNVQVAVKLTLLSLLAVALSIAMIYFSDKYLAAHAPADAQDVLVYEYTDEEINANQDNK